MTERRFAPITDEDPRSARAAALAAALADESGDPIARRDFLTRMGAAIALAGLAGCTRAPREDIVPYVEQPPEVRPGIPRFYATASVLDGYATGLLVESNVGRPTKVEGNPEHPASLGAAGVFEQASVLSLYDPTRARGVKARGVESTWPDVVQALTRGAWVDAAGRGLHFVLEPTSSPTVRWLLDEIRRRLPEIAVSFHSATPRANVWEGARIAFGRVLEPRIALERADVIVALDADLLAGDPGSLRASRQFAARRAVHGPSDGMNRLYVVEPLYTVTGANADHRLRVRASEVRAVAAALAAAVSAPISGGVPPALQAPAAPHRKWVDAVARDLLAHRGRSLVVAGDAQPPEVHALAHAINAVLGNIGVTVALAPSPIIDAGEPSHRLEQLTSALASGAVDTLVVCGANPVYTSPSTSDLGKLLARVRQSAYLGDHDDETAAVTTHVIARAHALESWGDARAFDGTVSLVQPLIEPLFGGRTEIELLAQYAGRPDMSGFDLVRARLRDDLARGGEAPVGSDEFEKAWRSALRRGIVDGTAIAPVPVQVDWAAIGAQLARAGAAPPLELGGGAKEQRLELVIRPDTRVHDGRFANNAWLLELPSLIAKLTWTNAAMLSVATAAKLGIETGDELLLRSDGREVKAAAVIVGGQADDTVGLTLGWGRSHGAELARGRGANAFVLAGDPLLRPLAVQLGKTGARRDLPITQTERSLHGRDKEVLQHGTLAAYRALKTKTNGNGREAAKDGSVLAPQKRHPEKPLVKRQLTLYSTEPGPARVQWAMAIDLSRCTGCSACMTACQAENNIPTVGPDNVVLNREMHWLRVDSYFIGDGPEAEVAPQPMLCQHCEMAPCEYVCPVNATVHSPDGLNEMVYNRCVGTRFCSNNCPYKVRRFNWFDFHKSESATEQLVHNPDVTVRQRGVMEKCTFCVQRLRAYDIATAQGRKTALPKTACQQTCPTEAIVFGDLLDRGSPVVRLHESDRTFAALHELGTEPRVRYLARLKNPNPELS